MTAGSALFTGWIALTLGFASAAGQGIVVRGRVVERGTDEAIAGATAELSGVGRTFTNPRGEFFFSVPRAGRRNLTVTMIGYRQHKSSVMVQPDSTLLVELEIEAVRLDEITVRKTRYTLRGDITHGERQPVVDADVQIGSNRSVRTNLSGRFKVGGLPTGEPVLVHVSALGLEPQFFHLQPQRDTSLQITMMPDPIGQRMIAMQVERLETRLSAIGYSRQAFNREALLLQSGPSIYDFVRRHLRANQRLETPLSFQQRSPPRAPCIFIDERPALLGMEELMHFLPETLERIEIVDRGAMVRVYTRRYIQEMMRRRAQPKPIVLAKGTGAPICG